MARTIPGSGASIKPLFNEVFGVRAVEVLEGGKDYTSADPPRLTITGCGTPDEEALLYPIIDDASGRIVHVRVLTKGRGYDPLRVNILPTSDTPNVVTSFDVKRIWQSNPQSTTSATFSGATDRLTIVSDNHPKPSDVSGERAPGGGPLVDRNFNQAFVYRGGKDAPAAEPRPDQYNKVTGILANGVQLHTPEWGQGHSDVPVGFSLDTVKSNFIKSNDTYDGVVNSNVYHYQSSKLINHLALKNGTLENGFQRVFTWNIKTEFDNLMIPVGNVSESMGAVEVGRQIELVGGNATCEVAKIVRNGSGLVLRVYVRLVNGTFSNGDNLLGANGFTMTINNDPQTFPNGLFYINFGPDAADFGAFDVNGWYLAPENIKVQANYLIIWNQSDASNQPTDTHTHGHPMQFSTTQDGLLNGGTLYTNSTGAGGGWSTDYENEFAPLFLMNPDETNRIYYYCKFHRYMSGMTGDEGYITFDNTPDNDPLTNNYYITDYFATGPDYARHADGHSKVLGMSYDGYPIYGPWGYNSSGTAAREVSGYRLKTGVEIDGNRPVAVTASTVTQTITVSSGKFYVGGSEVQFLNLFRGKTYVFNQDHSTNDSNFLLLSTQENGWQADGTANGDTSVLHTEGVTYQLEGVTKTYTEYISGFNAATSRTLTFTPRTDAPRLLYTFSYSTSNMGFRLVQDGYLMGDLTQDYIWDAAVSGATLDKFNGRFAVTPEYPNGTYAYFMSEDGSGNPVYPYVIGPQYRGVPIFEGDTLPAVPTEFPGGASGEVVLGTGGDAGKVSYIKMEKFGDGYFGTAEAKILGGGGTGALATPTVQTVTGLALLNPGRSFATPPTLIVEGGGGQNAKGAAKVDITGKVTSISVVNAGEFYQEPPYVLITGGGGIGARAEATISQGQITAINVTEQGQGFTSTPSVIFTKLVNLKRKTAARQSLNSTAFYLTGLLANMTASQTEIYVDSTDAYPGSGKLIINNETVSYSSKSREKFSNVTRGLNFNYDQRVILDSGQNAQDGTSNYKFNVGDRVIRRVENAANKIAKVYDWNNQTRELLVAFEVDELAFIDGGIPSTEDAIVQFDAGVADSANSSYQPHVVLISTGDVITTLTVPITTLQDKKFEDDDENSGAGDGIPDLVNTGTDFENQISLDGGIYNSLYGIEETQGGTNTTLFQAGDSIKDADIPFKYATITSAGALNEGVPHTALMEITIDANDGNGNNYAVNEVVTGDVSGVKGTVVSWNPSTGKLQVGDIIPFNTGNVNVGVAGYLYKFSDTGTIVDYNIQNSGTNYSSVPSVTVETIGDIQATGTAVLTAAGDQIGSITITNGGYGYKQSVDNTYNIHPTVTIAAPTSGTTAVAQAILGGEKLVGNGGASYRIKSIEFQTIARTQ